jgi:hypothetical protein
VFEIPEDEIKHSLDPAVLPHYWPWLWGFDFSHAGLSQSAHPWAAVLACHDRDNDVIYIMHASRMRQALPVNHVAAIKEHPCWGAPVCWPHDGVRQDLGSGETYAAMYKKLGLNMRAEHTTFKDGGYSFEGGISEMEQRFATGRLKIARHLSEWFEEYRDYHRENGVVNKVDDDLLSATRQVVMGIRHAKVLADDRPSQTNSPYRGWDGSFTRRRDGQRQADGLEFDVFTGE